MQHDPVNIAQAQALHPNWRQDDTILARLAQNAAEVPNQVAMRERDHGIWQEYTWADYLRAVVEFAAGLEARGVKPGDVVMVIGDNRPNLYFAMLGAACLRAIEIDADVVLKATKVDGVYTADPFKDPHAEKFERLTYDEVLDRKLGVMDLTAICLCRDHSMPLRVFNMNKPGALLNIVVGGAEGTLIEEDAQ